MYSLQTLLQCYVRYYRWGAPDINFPIGGMLRDPYTMSVLATTNYAMALYEPFLYLQHPWS
jgi:hypothetical protein